MTVAAMTPATVTRQTAIGLALAAAVIGAWLCIHVWAVFFFAPSGAGWLLAPAVIALQCWLSAGLFIVAHDAMHGSLAPFRPAVNRAAGRLALALYAGFSYDRILPKHHAHHRHPGTADDPDFDADHPQSFLAWYRAFFAEYFGWREAAIIAAVFWVYVLVFGAGPLNVVLFWAVPAIASSVQLFAFGTYLPHRPGAEAFPDRHNTRSNDYSRALSLLTCFHFGYHEAHHLAPTVPWWRLPGHHRRLGEHRRSLPLRPAAGSV